MSEFGDQKSAKLRAKREAEFVDAAGENGAMASPIDKSVYSQTYLARRVGQLEERCRGACEGGAEAPLGKGS
jgi:hypothetical protein